MQSLESSCQEADFIINDTLLKLKSSIVPSNIPPNINRQTTSTITHNRLRDQQQAHTYQKPSTSTSSSLLNHHSITQIPNQPPAYIFDGVDSPPDYSNHTKTLNEDDLLPVRQVTLTEAKQKPPKKQQKQRAAPSSTTTSVSTTALISNVNSIVSPSPIVPDTILSTPIEKPVTHMQNHVGGVNSPSLLAQPEASSIYSNEQNSNIQQLNFQQSGNTETTSPMLSSSASLPKRPRLTAATSASSQPLTSQSSSSPPLLHGLSNISNTQIEQENLMFPAVTVTNPPDRVRAIPELISADTINQTVLSDSTTPPLTFASGFCGQSTSFGASNPKFFDIFDKLRELYLYLLIHDEKAITETRRRHRTRSFVLERLVEREKLNTIVLNLHPGNKGYSLAFYQDDKQIELMSTESNIGNNCSTTDTTQMQIDRETSVSSVCNSNKFVLNTTANRTKQTQISINSENSVNALSTNNNYINSHNMNPGVFLGLEDNGIFNFDCDEDDPTATSLEHEFNEDSVFNVDVNDNMNMTSFGNVAVEDNDNINLVEVMRWPYEIEDLLIAIDNEELPQIFSDLLETRTPNVFYSGCVICEVRDFRQTFPISSNSCDIFHVLLRPTNDTLFSDVNQLQIESDINPDDKLLLESQLVLATAEPLCLDPDPKIGLYAINMQFKRQMWNTQKIRRQMKKYSQISINRKRKIDQFTHNYGLELCDYLQRMRQRPRSNSTANSNNNNNINNNNFSSGSGGVMGNLNSNSMNNSGMSNTSNSFTGGGGGGGSSVAASVASATAAVLSGLPTMSATTLSAFSSKLQKKPQDNIRPLRTPNLDYPPLAIPEDVHVERYAKAYERPRETKDCMPQLIEEYILERDREEGRIYHIKLSIYQRPANSEYLGELYVDRDFRVNERNGEACSFALGTRSHANRYIQQFTEIFTEEGRKSVKISHVVPGQTPKVSYTTGMSEHRKQQQQQALAAALIQQQLQQTILSPNATQQQHIHIQPAPPLISAVPNATVNNSSNANNLQHHLNINLQSANIVGITSAGNANLHHLRQQLNHPTSSTTQQFIDATGATVQLQTQPIGGPHHHLSLANGSLVLVQQQGQSGVTTTGLAIQTASGQQKIISTNQLTGSNSALRTQLGSNVPILQAQLKAAPLISNQQQHVLQTKTSSTIHSTNPTINALVTGIMNSANQFQQQQQQQQQQINVQQKTSGNAAILSLLNSAPAAMTSTPVASSTFTASSGQQQTAMLQTQQPTIITTENVLHQQQNTQQQQKQRHQNEVIQSLFNSTNLRKINMVTTTSNSCQPNRLLNSGQSGNLIAVGINQQQEINNISNLQQHHHQNVRVTMSALASQLASPPAIMTNANFGYSTSNTVVAAAQTNNNNNNIAITNNNNNNNSIKILNNSVGQRIPAQLHRRDSSSTISMAAPSPGSDSNQSSHSVASSNLGFAMPGLSALLATSPSPSSEHSQQSGSSGGSCTGLGNIVGISSATLASNQALLERLNSGTNHRISTSPSLSPQLPPPQQQKSHVQQQIINVQSPASSISPMSSPPPPQPSPQLQQQQHIQISSSPLQHNISGHTTTTTLNLQGINLSSLQGAMATFPGLQNVQVQIPGLNQPISLSLSGASLAAAVQQQQNALAAAASHQNSSQQQPQQQQQTTSLLVSVPVTSTTQVNTMQTVSGSGVGNSLGLGSGTTVVQVPVSSVAAGTQTVVLTTTPNSGSGQGQTHSLSLAQLVASGVKMNPQALRAAASLHHQQQHGSNLIQSSPGTVNIGPGGTVNLTTNTNVVSVGGGNNVGNIQLLSTLQQRQRSIQVVGSKQLGNRGHLQMSQRNFVTTTSGASGQTLKIATSTSGNQQISSTRNLITNPMTAQKLQLKLQKQAVLHQQLHQHELQHQLQQHQQQQQQHHNQQRILTSSGVPATIAVSNQNQKRRRSATDVNK